MSARRGVLFKKTVNGAEKTFYRYHMLLPINHGLCQGQILPSGVHINITFHRASPAKGWFYLYIRIWCVLYLFLNLALVDIANSVVEFGSPSIPLLDPVLQGRWAYGPKLDNQMSKVRSSGLSIPFESNHIRHRVIQDGLMEYRMEIIQGPLPDYIVFFLMTPERFSNDLKLSSTKMEMHGLEEFTLILDNVVQENYPLKVVNYGGSKFYHEFYRRWLVETNNYGDSEVLLMNEDTYINGNFLILETFKDFDHKDGHLAVKLKFQDILDDKLFLCWMPCTKKTLKFDRNLSVQVV